MKRKANKQKEFDQGLQMRFRNFSPEPPKAIWENINKELEVQKPGPSILLLPFLKSNKRYIAYAATITLLIAISGISITQFFELDRHMELISDRLTPKFQDLVQYKDYSHKLELARTAPNRKRNNLICRPPHQLKSIVGKGTNLVRKDIQEFDQKTLPPDAFSQNIPTNKETEITSDLNKSNPELYLSHLDLEKQINNTQVEKEENPGNPINTEDYKQALKDQFLAENKSKESHKQPKYISLGLIAGNGVDLLNKDEKVQLNYIDIPLQIQLNKSSFIQTGLTWVKGTSKSQANIEYERHTYVDSYQKAVGYSYRKSSIGEDSLVFHFKKVEIYDTCLLKERINNESSFSRIEIPALLGWEYKIGRFNLQVKGGPNLGMLISKKQKFHLAKENEKDRLEVFEKEYDVSFDNDFYLQFQFATGIEISCSPRLALNLQPQWRYFVQSPYKNNKQLSGFDLKVGMSYRFK